MPQLIESPAPRTSIDSIGIVTCGRPDLLRRALESYAPHARGHRARIVVADDSSAEAHRRENADAIRDVARAHRLEVRHLHRGERGDLARTLAVRGKVPRDVVELALFGDDRLGSTVGANRNALLLACAGTPFFSSDDDIVARLSGPADASADGPRWWLAPEDPCGYRFFARRADAIRANPVSDVDVLDAHQRWLGRRFEFANHTMPGRVVATFFGILGDSGLSSSAALLYGTNAASRDHMTEDEARYRIAMAGREIVRVVSAPTLARPMPFFGGAMALDARGLLPPFFPVLRNEDGMFGRMLGFLYSDAFCMHLPSAILHGPPERGPYPSGFLETARSSRFCELLLSAMLGSPLAQAPADAAGRLQWLGDRFARLADVSPADFEKTTRELLSKVVAAKTQKLSTLLASAAAGSRPHWANDARALLRAFDEGVASGETFVMRELGTSEGEANRHAQALLRRFGAVLRAWPALYDAARELTAAAA